MLSSKAEFPKPESIKSLDIGDIAIMNQLAYSFKDEFIKYAKIDSFTSPDPFKNENPDTYLIVVDRENIERIVAMIIIIHNDLDNSKIPLEKIKNDRLKIIQIPKEKALLLKYEMMPKDTNNFYQFRKDSIVIGYIMFAFQICGQHY
ncbi:MAG TPA: hypothetical protein VFT83_01365 [Nitrososphaeraceae archaeon]|nr:hypothetical protein [Nitrososphaeraceae archaeon]HEU5172152.1 hypothetical protein [Nitrososphaeraceae archaeon]